MITILYWSIQNSMEVSFSADCDERSQRDDSKSKDKRGTYCIDFLHDKK